MNVLRTGGAGSPPAAVVQGADADGSGLTEQGYPPGESPSIFFQRQQLPARSRHGERPPDSASPRTAEAQDESRLPRPTEHGMRPTPAAGWDAETQMK
ncbi:hypothetical protein M9458_010006, partial [Cirrhinus mrigala]